MWKKPELPEVEPVRLKAVKGIRPGVFILGVLVLALILILFALFVLPGLVSGTGYISFNTNTVNTSIKTDDGKYIGSSEGSVYRLDAGDYRFHFYIDGVEAGYVDAAVPHRIFFTLFSHRTDTVSFSAENSPEIEEAVTRTFAEGVASWSKVLDYSETYHFPPLFSDYATNAAALGFEDATDTVLYGAMHITGKEMYDDYLKALSILDEGNIQYSSSELEELNKVLSSVYGSGMERKRTMDNPAIEGTYSDGFFHYAPVTIEMGKDATLSYPESNTAPVSVEVPQFAIADRPVTEYEYALFVEAVPYWSRTNLSQLIEDGVADEGYLDGIALSSSIMSTRPIRNISYYAAEAYCSWLSEKTGMDISLPSEAEWYVAALSAEDKEYVTSLLHLDAERSAPSSMMGGVWEMTDTPYIPLMRLAGYAKALELGGLYPYDGIIVKGGSYINSPSQITIETVGVADKASTSPYIGFRICAR